MVKTPTLITMRSRPTQPLFLLIMLAVYSVAHAQSERPTKPLWELGAVGIGLSQQAYPGSDEQVNRAIALPYVLYRGKYFRADRDTVGLRAINTPRYEFDLSFAGSLGAGSNKLKARQGMPDLGTLGEFGPRLLVHLNPEAKNGRWTLDIPIRGVFDLSDGLKTKGYKFEPTINYAHNIGSGWFYTVSGGAAWADTRLSETLYSVAPANATASRPAYQAQSGLMSLRASAAIFKDIGSDWRLFAYARMDSVAGARNEISPLVQRKIGGTLGLGVSYTWMRSSQSASD